MALQGELGQPLERSASGVAGHAGRVRRCLGPRQVTSFLGYRPRRPGGTLPGMTNDTIPGAAAAPHITRAGEGEARWWVGCLAEVQLTAEQTGGALSVLTITDPPDTGAPLHVHHHDDETFILLEGSAVFEVGGETIEARAGDVVFGPRGVPHRYTTGPDGLKVVFVMTPGGFERLVRDMSDPASSRTVPPAGHPMPEVEAMDAIARRHGCELLLDEA